MQTVRREPPNFAPLNESNKLDSVSDILYSPLSKIIDTEAEMAHREKSTAVILVGYLAVYTWYFARVVDAARSGPIAKIDYQGLVIVMVGVLVSATVVAQVLIAILTPSEAEQVDERDRMIALRGDRNAWWVVTIGALGGLVLAMIEADRSGSPTPCSFDWCWRRSASPSSCL